MNFLYFKHDFLHYLKSQLSTDMCSKIKPKQSTFFRPTRYGLRKKTLWIKCLHLLIYLSGFLNRETSKWPFWSSSQAATWYYLFNHSTV